MEKSSLFPKIASRCETCHGAGVLPGRCREDELLPCPTCKGKGVIARKKSKKHVEERACDNPNCKNGRVQQLTVVDGREVLTEKVCPVCDGYGVIYNETVTTTTVHEKCPTCGGAAVITAGEMRRQKARVFLPRLPRYRLQIRRTTRQTRRCFLASERLFTLPSLCLAQAFH